MTDPVTLAFTAHARNVGLARSVAAAMAARADLPIDQLEDVRLAVDEAVTLQLMEAPHDGLITCVFDVEGTTLDIRVSAPSRSGREPARDTFSWTVLTALVDSVTVSTDEDTVTLTLSIARRAPAEA
jgi:serine/threonine-protein kinase RsbW